MSMKNFNLTDKRVLVVGLGASGLAAARLVLEKGAGLWVTEKEDNPDLKSIAYDLIQRGAILELGKHTEDFVKEKDLIVISPAVDARHEVIQWANKYKIPIISELEFASRYIDYPLICVTGTNGKSTVTTLIDYILKIAGKRTVACGNLGMPLSEVVLNYKNLDFAVVEVSSFQLEFIKDFRPHISVWLNFSYDHLDHHASMDEYLNAKLRIFENQTNEDWAVIYYEENKIVGDINPAPSNGVLDPAGRVILPSHSRNKLWGFRRRGGIKAKKILYGDKSGIEFVVEDSLLNGMHNHDNIQAAFSVAKICGIESEIIKNAVRTFKPLAHRMEHVAVINNINFIDDSKATNVHAVIPALNSLSKPVILILGGRDKGDDFTRLKGVVREKVKDIIVIGEAKEKIKAQLKGTVPISESETIQDAVNCAFKQAVPGTTVLLSPGCSSFDMFKDYKERGEKFKEEVMKIKNQISRFAKSKTRLAKIKIEDGAVLPACSQAGIPPLKKNF